MPPRLIGNSKIDHVCVCVWMCVCWNWLWPPATLNKAGSHDGWIMPAINKRWQPWKVMRTGCSGLLNFLQSCFRSSPRLSQVGFTKRQNGGNKRGELRITYYYTAQFHKNKHRSICCKGLSGSWFELRLGLNLHKLWFFLFFFPAGVTRAAAAHIFCIPPPLLSRLQLLQKTIPSPTRDILIWRRSD